MSSRCMANVSASIAARIKNWAAANSRTYQHALNRYATERFFARLETSGFADRLVLKGGNLFVVWFSGKDYRPTMDADFLCRGKSLGKEEMISIFKDICQVQFSGDGIMFDDRSINVESIRADTRYGGQRISLKAYIGNIRIPLQFDVGFGDVITPAPEKVAYPAMLDFPSPQITAYPMFTAIAEKCAIMVELGYENSRMKDYYDVWTILNSFDISATKLREAISRTFARRGTITTNKTPLCFTEEFAIDKKKSVQWKSYLRKNQISEDCPNDFAEVAGFIAQRLLPLMPKPDSGREDN